MTESNKKMIAAVSLALMTFFAIVGSYGWMAAAEQENAAAGEEGLVKMNVEEAITEEEAMAAALTAYATIPWPADEEGMINQYEGIIRFHIIANSDSEADQRMKLMVRNNVMTKIENGITNEFLKLEAGGIPVTEAHRAAVTKKYVVDHLEEIRTWAEDCVRAKGYDHEVAARVGITAIRAKNYDDIYFPAGNYEALTITIGEGAGQNWWCVVFPPLCLIDCTDSAYRDYFDETGDGRIVLKSRIRELVQKSRSARG